MGIPLWRKAQQAKVDAASIYQESIAQQALNYNTILTANMEQQRAKLLQHERAIQFYQTDGKVLAQEIIRTASGAFQNGNIDFLQYIQSLENAQQIEMEYLNHLYQYNLVVLDLNYLLP
jgi:cobalt-zinc-cadmium resistance protein CzcA